MHWKIVPRILIDGVLSASLSSLPLLIWGKDETGSAAAPINAISHWLWARKALRRDGVSGKYTATGMAVHYLASLFWCSWYEWLRSFRSKPTQINAVGDAVGIAAAAAWVDLRCVPERLTPGFERRLSSRALVYVYGGFAIGLALGGILTLKHRNRHG